MVFSMRLKEFYNQMEDLQDIGLSDKGDRHPSHNHFYIDIYDEIISPMKDEPVQLFEIGISTGASLVLWSQYLKNGIITGLDKNIPQRIDYLNTLPNVNIIQGPAYEEYAVNKLCESLPLQDVLIEDGSHLIEDQIRAIHLYHRLVKPGGYFIVEDIYLPNLIPFLTQGVYQLKERSFITTIYDYHRRPRGLADDVMVVIKFFN